MAKTGVPAAAPAVTPAAMPAVAPAVALAVAPAVTQAVTPTYWDEARRHLARRDRVMKKLIPRFGEARLASRGDAFTTLARSIVGQQISVKAAQSVWDRFAAAVAGPHAHLQPQRVLALSHEALRGAGLSARKAEYLLDLADHFGAGGVQVGQWAVMDDEAIIAELVAIRGIGRWTAEMFLIFHLLRPNVLPLDDLGLLKGISLQYFSGEPVSRAEAREVGEAWAPYRSVATWYIWRSLDPLPVDY
jgi:DNA-3-methyladenine glycosylase II